VWAKVDKVLAILGPTCTGKSELALDLAAEMDGEIVNADSMQVYKDFDIGTAKPDGAARSRIPHHLIDVVVPTEQFNGAAFKRMADEAISLIQGRGKVPITVGGTGLYLRVCVANQPQGPGPGREGSRSLLRVGYKDVGLAETTPLWGKKI
jgi:tRNA dimethylallyltransferase